MSVTSMSTTNPILSLDASSGITKSVPTPSGASSMMSSGQHARHPQPGEKSSDGMPMPNNRVVSNGGYCRELDGTCSLDMCVGVVMHGYMCPLLEPILYPLHHRMSLLLTTGIA